MFSKPTVTRLGLNSVGGSSREGAFVTIATFLMQTFFKPFLNANHTDYTEICAWYSGWLLWGFSWPGWFHFSSADFFSECTNAQLKIHWMVSQLHSWDCTRWSDSCTVAKLHSCKVAQLQSCKVAHQCSPSRKVLTITLWIRRWLLFSFFTYLRIKQRHVSDRW